MVRRGDPAPWFSRIRGLRWWWDAELGGRLCFNAESDCGAGELLVGLLREDADPDDDWVSPFEAAAKNKRGHPRGFSLASIPTPPGIPLRALTLSQLNPTILQQTRWPRRSRYLIIILSVALYAGSSPHYNVSSAARRPANPSCFDHSARAKII